MNIDGSAGAAEEMVCIVGRIRARWPKVKIVKIHYLWRVVDQEGEVLEAFVTKRRNRQAALTFLRKAMKRYGRPETLVTDKLGAYRAALRTIGNAARQGQAGG